MHKTHAVNSWLLWLAVLLPWGSMAADPPPPLVRSVLSTNVAPFGATGQALFRTTASPYLDWSNTVNADGVTNLVQSKSNFIVSAHGTLNVSNDAVFGTNKVLITTNGNIWKKGMIVSDYGLGVGTNTATLWGYWPDDALIRPAFVSFRDTDKEASFNEAAWGVKSGLGSGLFGGFGSEMTQDGAGFWLQATTNINTSSYFWVDLNNGSNAAYQTKFYMKHLGTNLFYMGEGGDWTNRGFHVSRDIISSNSLTVKGEQTNSGGIHFTNVTMPGGGDSGVMMANQTNLLITNGAALLAGNSNGNWGIGTLSPSFGIDVTKGANTFAKFGSTLPVYLMANNPNWGLNLYFDGSNWRYGAGSSSKYGGVMSYSASSGQWQFYSTQSAGNDGNIASLTPALFCLNVNGNIGLGTNSPQSRLHVTYDNSVFNGIQWGSTNRPQQGTVSTNGVLRVDPGGGLNQLGVYGSLMMNATNIIVCAAAASVYTNVAGTGFTTIVTNGFFGNTAAVAAGLTNLYAGWYRVTISVSAVGANNQATEWEIVTNGVACDLVGFKKTYDAASRMDGLSATGTIYLPALCGTQFMVQDGGTGASIAVHRAALNIGTP